MKQEVAGTFIFLSIYLSKESTNNLLNNSEAKIKESNKNFRDNPVFFLKKTKTSGESDGNAMSKQNDEPWKCY